jgi:hypothetical protein
MLGRHSPIELLPQPQILLLLLLLLFTLAVLGLNSVLYACKAALYCFSHKHFQPEWPGSEPIAFLMR